jgi:hypothetical protein
VNEPVEFPDAERIVIDYLAARVGVPVSLTVPNPRPASFVTVQRVGGPRLNLVADDATLAVEAWAASPTAAKAVLGVARAHVLAMGRQVVDGVPVYRVTEVGGPAYLPDPDSAQARYTLTVQVALRGVALEV